MFSEIDFQIAAQDRQATLLAEASTRRLTRGTHERIERPAADHESPADAAPAARGRTDLRLKRANAGISAGSRTMERVATRVSSPLFIGRRPELKTLTDAVAQADAGGAGVIPIGGDAGIGKTRLVAEIADQARQTGALVLEGGCVSIGDGGGLPFAPIVEALRRLPTILADDPNGAFGTIQELRSPATAELGRLIPELGSTLGREG